MMAKKVPELTRGQKAAATRKANREAAAIVALAAESQTNRAVSIEEMAKALMSSQWVTQESPAVHAEADSRTFWIIWNPQSGRPPTRQFAKEEEAFRVAESMASRHPGERFFVMKAVGFAGPPPAPPVVTEKFNG
jgi:hypothetical protein